jgi:hypothetical protein
LAALVGALLGGRNPWIVPAAMFLLILGFSYISVVVGPTGVTIRSGALGWPRRHIPLDRISAARVVSIDPVAYGGWGWRVRPGLSAVIVRGGNGLELDLNTGARSVVSVDDAEQAAGLINDLLARRP